MAEEVDDGFLPASAISSRFASAARRLVALLHHKTATRARRSARPPRAELGHARPLPARATAETGLSSPVSFQRRRRRAAVGPCSSLNGLRCRASWRRCRAARGCARQGRYRSACRRDCLPSCPGSSRARTFSTLPSAPFPCSRHGKRFARQRFSERPAFFSVFLTCSYWRARLVPFLLREGAWADSFRC